MRLLRASCIATMIFVLLSGGASSALADPIQTCGILTGGNVFGTTVAPGYTAKLLGQDNEGCNVLVTFNSDGSITTTHPNTSAFYDSGGDDNAFGIINNTGSAITSIHLSSGSVQLFGFDGDGICGGSPGFTFSALGPNCAGASERNGYGPAGVTFTDIANFAFAGNVNFGGGGIAANGGAGWFSLEGPVAQDLAITITPTTSAIPEPSSLLLVGTSLLGLGVALRRRIVSFNKKTA